ncbi:MAG TPA: tetraprenyl-beta-curcumene synthase family protein [Syntrophomonadaceae bacterium]|nr:tetraprenyl-beta-curcumene synthase family protein [Syntrophomonadaceae bacterium]
MIETLMARSERGRRLALVTRFVIRVFPQVERELGRWRERIAGAGDRELAAQGVASIKKKRFHCQGGSVYALAGGADGELVPFIVAFQTISDYLDNLCDRTGCLEADAFRQLHTAFTDALDPDREPGDYYRLFPHRDDGGYLAALVQECRSVLRSLPSYGVVKRDALWLAGLYSDLQTFKHAHLPLRETLLKNWFAAHSGGFPELDWWEFAAATGSTLGIFALCAAAGRPGLTAAEARAVTAGYFPWICGLHILLDYLIDQEEDRKGGDLNFVSYYPGPAACRERLAFFLKRALEAAAALPEPLFHTTVVLGLPAFYLSDPKVRAQGLEETAELLLSTGGRETLSMYRLCRILRALGKI